MLAGETAQTVCLPGMNKQAKGEGMLRERALVEWYRASQGAQVLTELRTELAGLLAERFGFLGVQLGAGELVPPLLEASRVRQREVISSLPGCGTIRAVPEALPLAAESTDLLILTHTLEQASDPYQVLRELERVLVPEGDAVLISFNPWSLWGGWSWLVGIPWRGEYAPWNGRFYSASRVKDWLRLLDFEVIEVRRLVYRPPSWRGWIGERLRWMERLGPRWFPLLGGVQVLVARKRRTATTLIRPRWRRLPVLAGGVVKPTSRSMCRVDKDS